MRTILLAGLVTIAAAAPCMASDFHLICTGSGVAEDSSAITTQTHNSKGESKTATTMVDRSKPFDGEAEVQVVNGVGRIRLPRAFLPMPHGGKDGWFELRNLVETENAVTAKAAVSFMSKPNVRLNRLTGSIAVDGGLGNFSGRCQPYDPAKAKRIF